MIKVAVVSGKGGVGKTTIAVSLALALAKSGFKVGLVDADVTGSNVPDILGRVELGVSDRDTLIPAISRGVKYVSIGQIASDGKPVLWDPKDVRSAARQLLERTDWGDIDYLIFDFPPGFEAETIELLPLMDYVLIVTIPSMLSKSKVLRMVEACREYERPIIGVIMNMSYVECPSCGYRHIIFAEDHSFEEFGIPTIAELPLSHEIAVNKLVNEFPLDKFLEGINNPVILKKKRISISKLVELAFKVM